MARDEKRRPGHAAQGGRYAPALWPVGRVALSAVLAASVLAWIIYLRLRAVAVPHSPVAPRVQDMQIRPGGSSCRLVAISAYAFGMTEFGPDDPERRKLAMDVLENYLVYRVETGHVEIGNRATEEILADLIRNSREAVDKADSEVLFVSDHRDLLLGQASSAVSEGALEIAVVLYATWIEHYINGLLLVALERQGVSPQSSRALIRELRLPTKVTALWELAHLPALSPTHLQLIDKIASLRNAFVHYKWPGVVEEHEDRQRREFGETISRIDSLVQMFHEVEDQALWYGRRDEIIQAFREGGDS